MRKITTKAVHAFRNGRPFNLDNTSVELDVHPILGGNVILKLHGNQIAKYALGGWDDLVICDGGWSSNTTKERLNGLPGVSVCQRAGTWYLNGMEWDGTWIHVNGRELKEFHAVEKELAELHALGGCRNAKLKDRWHADVRSFLNNGMSISDVVTYFADKR